MLFFKKGKDLPHEASEEIDANSLLEKHENGLMDDKSFLTSFRDIGVVYSTPFGDHKDGGHRLFVLPDQERAAFLPVFTTEERAREFYEKVGRCGFLILHSSFLSFLETTRKINEGNPPVKLGAVIDPGYYGVTIGANILSNVIEWIK